MDTQETLLPLRTAARLTGLKPENLRAEVESGNLPSVKVGDQYLYPLETIRAALLARIKDHTPTTTNQGEIMTVVNTPKDRWLTVRDVAAMLNVTSRTIWRLSASGRIPRPVRIGPKSPRWRESTLIGFLDSL